MIAKNLFKVFCSVAILVFLLPSREKFLSAWEVLRTTHFGYWFAGVAMISLAPIIAGLRTKLILGPLDQSSSYWDCVRDCAISVVFNTLLVGGSGELYRINGLRKRGVPLGISAATIVADRLWGLATVGVLAVILAFSEMHSSAEPALNHLGIQIVLGLMILTIVLLLIQPRAFSRKTMITTMGNLAQILTMSRLAKIMGLSIAGALITFANVYFCLFSIGLNSSFTYVAVASAVAFMASLLPISFGGLGVREFSYVYLLEPIATPEQAVALGLVQYSTLIGQVILILLLQVFWARRSKKA